ncbi:MAG: MMPL family transporter [Chloroflexia bacterium]|nr:MMPL family transporter [Chloroflexia bacterium]
MASLSATARLARVSSHHPWRTVGLWIVLLLVFGGLQAVLPMKTTTDFNLLNDAESDRGWNLLTEHGIRQERSGTETVIVRSATTNVDDPAFQQAVQGVTDTLRADPEIVASATNFYEVSAQDPNAAAGLVSNDRRTTIIPVTLTGSLEDAVEHGAEFLAVIEEQGAAAAGFEVLTVGDGSLNEEINTIVEEDIARGEGIGAGIAFIILLVVFAALVAAFIPIILAVISIGIAFGLAAIVSQIAELSFFVTSMMSMIGLAVGIDYALFVVERYREERRRGAAKHDAIEIAGATSSRAVFFSGLTVVFALIGMFIVPNNIYRSLAVGAILVVVVAVCASMTLIPAVLSLLGDKIDWPRRRKYGAATAEKQDAYDHETIHSGFWGRITRVVMAHPVISLVGSVALLVLCFLPYLAFEPSLGGATTLPDELESKAAYNVLSTEFSAGLISPVEIVVEGPLADPSVQAGIDTLVAQLGTTQLDGQPLFGPASVTPSEDGRVALISVPLRVAPDQKSGLDAITLLRDEIAPPIERTMAGSQILVTGITANNVDFLNMRDTYTPIVFTFVLGLSFLLLLVVFRSLVVAAKAIVMNLLSVGAAYGLLVLVFQNGYFHTWFGFQTVEGIEAWLPLYLFSILFGLSMDYHVFLLSRIKEHYDLTGRNTESVAVGLQATAKIITGAALIMVAVFGGFAAGRLTFLQQMGFGLGVAVLLDATIVRSILVPSAMAMLKDWNWYLPSWLEWLPNVHIEGTAVESAAPPAGAPAGD